MNNSNKVIVISATQLDEAQKKAILGNLSAMLTKPTVEFSVDETIGSSLMIHVSDPVIYTGDVTKVTVISASDLSEEQQEHIKSKLTPLMENPIFNFEVDTKLIGGLVFRVNDKLIDTSIQGKLASILEALQ